MSEIKKIFDAEIAELAESFREFPWQDKHLYGNWVAQTYYLVRHTPRLLGLLAGKSGPNQESLHKMALSGLREEENHELLALNDLKKLSYSLEDFPELPQTSAIYQSQYYRIEYSGPITLLGYAFMLEGLASSVGKQITDILTEFHGAKAVSFLRVHAVHDVDHYGEGIKFLDNISKSEEEGIIANLKQSRVLYQGMMEAISKERSSTSYFKKSA